MMKDRKANNMRTTSVNYSAAIQRRKRRLSASRPAARFTSYCVLVFLLFAPAKAMQYLGCQAAIKSATDDAWLSGKEFRVLVDDLSLGTLDLNADPWSAPASVLATFVEHSSGYQGINVEAVVNPDSASAEDVTMVESFCKDLFAALSEAFGVEAIDQDRCDILIAWSDDGNDRYQSPDFVQFVADNSQYSPSSFDSLPEQLRSFFFDWENNGAINFFRNGQAYKLSFCTEAMTTLAAMEQVPLADVSSVAPVVAAPQPSMARRETSAPSRGPVTPSTSPDNSEASTLSMSDEFYKSCKTALFVGDLSKDLQLSDVEYVRFLNYLLKSIFVGYSFERLPLVFQDAFKGIAGDAGSLDVAGAKPNESPTPNQEENLYRICVDVNAAIQSYESAVPSQSPLADGIGANSTLPTSIDKAEYRLCQIAMILGDKSKDDQINAAEYAIFINRMMLNEFAGMTFEELDPIFQSSFYSLSAGSGAFDVAGSKQDADTTYDQLANLRSVCLTTIQAIYRYENPGAVGLPTYPPVPERPSPVPSPSVTFLQSVTPTTGLAPPSTAPSDTALPGSAPPSLSALPDSPTVGLIAPSAQPSPAGTDAPTRTLTSPPTIEKDIECWEALVEADAKGSEPAVLQPVEYLSFVNALADDRWLSAESLDELPFIVSDNFAWLSFGPGFVDISGVFTGTSGTAESSQLVQRICRRTRFVVDLALEIEAKSAGGPLAFCVIPMKSVDTNENGKLSTAEFTDFTNILSGGAWGDVSFDSLPGPLRRLYESYKDLTGEVPIAGTENEATGNASYSSNICVGAEEAVKAARLEIGHCINLLAESDSDNDEAISREEFPAFVFALAGVAYNNETFDDLDRAFQFTFAALREQWLAIDVSGATGSPTPEELARLQFVCLSVGKDLDLIQPVSPVAEPSTPSASPNPAAGDRVPPSPTAGDAITVYNSFLISNIDGMGAAEVPRAGLEQAYELFVSELVQTGDPNRLRSRMLQSVEYKPNSSELYLIVDSDCPVIARSKAVCQTVYGRFDLLASDPAVATVYEELSQAAIESGTLQSKLEQVDPNNFLLILGSSTPVLPPPSAVEPSDSAPEPTTIWTLPLIIGIAVAGLAVLLIVVGGIIFVVYRPGRRQARRAQETKVTLNHQSGSDPEATNNSTTFNDSKSPAADEQFFLFDHRENSAEDDSDSIDGLPYEGSLDEASTEPQVPSNDVELGKFVGASSGPQPRDATASSNWGSLDALWTSPENPAYVPEEKPADAASTSRSSFASDDQVKVPVPKADSDEDSEDDTIEESVFSSSQPGALYYRSQIEAFLRENVPDELENLDAMMEQYKGREPELFEALRHMADVELSSDADTCSEASKDSHHS